MDTNEKRENWERVAGAEEFDDKPIKPLTWGEIMERMSVPIKWETIAWAAAASHVPALGLTAGVHRLWTHRAYKAKIPLRIILMMMYSVAGLTSIFHWVKEHRVHHKFSETDADPHNARRGFFYSHVGWILQRRHPEFLRRSREIDMTDILSDPVAVFHKKYVTQMNLLFCFIIPTVIPVVCWGEILLHAVLTQCFIRHVLAFHFLWSVNSFAHLYGTRPYNRLINPAENRIVSLFTLGEGSHNYHHTFPWDYKASEFPYFNFNSTTLFIQAFEKIGWAYDLREPSPELVDKVVRRVGYKSLSH
ncbi:acyl-CoA Delta(11) desaturase-like isoform X2 [Athalia rosae]|uniref:acyl-CoA Delta(11) desaturase-like isoform X2 n=1 Tax=Athalia rosae TaxID=37344 RepID=UPI002033B9CD|nr:acyl-CoA Delta(11) desaturase-like isoform X2 [Athalia rosae]